MGRNPRAPAPMAQAPGRRGRYIYPMKNRSSAAVTPAPSAPDSPAPAPMSPEAIAALPPAAAERFRELQTYFQHQAVPVADIRYVPSIDLGALGKHDAPSWSEAHFAVAFHDVESYRRYENLLPRKVSGVKVYADSEQAIAFAKIRRSEHEAALIAKAAGYFKENGFSVASVGYAPPFEYDAFNGTPAHLEVVFNDAASYRRWQKRFFRRVAGTAVSASLAAQVEGPPQTGALDRALLGPGKRSLPG